MKKIILSITFLLIVFIGNAQSEDFIAISKGNLLVGGDLAISFSSTSIKSNGNKEKASSTFVINTRPKVGYFFTDNIVGGLELLVQSSSTKQESDDSKINVNKLAIGPFGRYYFNNGIFAESFVGIGSGKSNIPNPLGGDTDLKSSVFGFRLGVGYSQFLGTHVALEPTINYLWESNKFDDLGTTDIMSTIEVGLGFKVYLAR